MSDYKAVDPQGRPVKLSTYMKNKMYKHCKNMVNDIKDSMCTKNECNNPSERNVEKMINKEFATKNQRDLYRRMMGNIGADPKDCGTEKFRRQR